MKRRSILLGSVAAAAAPMIGYRAQAQVADGAVDASRLTKDLTPFGAERAGSSSGLVPAWTGGLTPAPEGQAPANPPNLFPNQQPLFTVTADNMAQYANMLSEGQQEMLKRYGGQGYKIVVYPCQRTAMGPQYIYDATAANVTRAQPVAAGLLYGIQGTIGGPAFPILSADPAISGIQAIFNHKTRWKGVYTTFTLSSYIVSNGQANLAGTYENSDYYAYSDPRSTPDNDNGVTAIDYISYYLPSNETGSKYLGRETLGNAQPPLEYEYLVGEGRIRQAPNAEYDIPTAEEGDAVNIDENDVFLGPIDRYDWKLVGKKEMIIPYNVYDLYHSTPDAALGPNFVKPELIRHEVHRCWVLEAKLRPGKRMSEPFRRFYLEEDSWAAVMGDAYDAQGVYWKYSVLLPMAAPQMPGVASFGPGIFYNLQAAEYVITLPFFDMPSPVGSVMSFLPVPLSQYDPQSLANSGGL